MPVGETLAVLPGKKIFDRAPARVDQVVTGALDRTKQLEVLEAGRGVDRALPGREALLKRGTSAFGNGKNIDSDIRHALSVHVWHGGVVAAQQIDLPDPGLYGPDSVTWRVHSDPSMALGGLRALLLQAVHPLAMAGVAQHSDFRGDPWGRLFRTAEYVGVTTYGTTQEARRAGAKVRGIHRQLGGIEPESGQAYRVNDPRLLTWVHCCETESFLSTAVRCGLRLTKSEQDRYYAEQVRGAELVGLTTAPDSVQAMQDYFQAMRPELRVTAEAWKAARFVLIPPMPTKVVLGTPARPAWLALATASAAMLPRWARRMYRLPGLPFTDLGASAAGIALRSGFLVVPGALRDGPQVKAAKKRLSGL